MSKKFEFPFNSWSRKHIRNNEKCCTSRGKTRCEPGDYFDLEGKTYVVFIIERHSLGYVRDYLYSFEGAASPEEFDKVWRAVMRRKKGIILDYGKTVFVHWFRPVEDPDEFKKNRKLGEFLEIEDV
jgi:hypothetical protein